MSKRKKNKLHANSPFELLLNYWSNLSDNKFILTEGGKASIKRFLQELSPDEIQENMNISFERIPDNNKIEERFRYFCGVCWNKINGIYYNASTNQEVS